MRRRTVLGLGVALSTSTLMTAGAQAGDMQPHCCLICGRRDLLFLGPITHLCGPCAESLMATPISDSDDPWVRLDRRCRVCRDATRGSNAVEVDGDVVCSACVADAVTQVVWATALKNADAPRDPEAEDVVIGGLLRGARIRRHRDGRDWLRVVGADFLDVEHGCVVAAITDLQDCGLPAGEDEAGGWLRRHGLPGVRCIEKISAEADIDAFDPAVCSVRAAAEQRDQQAWETLQAAASLTEAPVAQRGRRRSGLL